MTYEEAMKSIPCGRYRHFKGNEYEVIGIARHSEDVIYEIVDLHRNPEKPILLSIFTKMWPYCRPYEAHLYRRWVFMPIISILERILSEIGGHRGYITHPKRK